VKEQALRIGQDQSLVGILSEGDAVQGVETHRDTAVLLLNAGLIHHIGPNRIYVKLARRLAKMGLTVLRLDFSGIGDSGPRMDKLPANESMSDEGRQAMDLLEQQFGIKRFVCFGLCAGAAAATYISLADERVKKVILVNPLLPKTPQTDLMYYTRYYRTQALFNPRSWLKLFLLKASYRTLWQAVVMKLRFKFKSNLQLKDENPEIVAELQRIFQHFNTRRIRLLLAYSDDDIGELYLKSVIRHEYDSLMQSGLMQTEKLAGADHLVTPLACQDNLFELVAGWLNEPIETMQL
jgi:pimeloyl-ACP methyl ester carboxylesterase